jgi:hypothetical protein
MARPKAATAREPPRLVRALASAHDRAEQSVAASIERDAHLLNIAALIDAGPHASFASVLRFE